MVFCNGGFMPSSSRCGGGESVVYDRQADVMRVLLFGTTWEGESMQKRKIKDLLYEQVARVGKAVSSPKRLEMLEVLVQGEKMVDALARDVGIDIKLASSHLRVLKEARLVTSRRQGRFIAYRLSGDDVGGLWVSLHMVAEEHLMDLRAVLEKIIAAPERLTPETRADLLDKARQGDILVL